MQESQINIECSQHPKKYIKFGCLNQECDKKVKYGCFKCMHELHEFHLQDMQELDEIKVQFQNYLQINETLITALDKLLRQAEKDLNKIKEQFESSKKMLNQFPSLLNYTDINKVIIDFIQLTKRNNQNMVQNLMENLPQQICSIAGMSEKSENNKTEQSQQLQEAKLNEEMIEFQVFADAGVFLTFTIQISKEIPFHECIIIIEKAMVEILNSEHSQFSYPLTGGQALLTLDKQDTRTLHQLGFINGCTLRIQS